MTVQQERSMMTSLLAMATIEARAAFSRCAGHLLRDCAP